jgi:galactokinase
MQDAVRRVLLSKGGEPRSAFFVPGRVEVLGKHTDYPGGRSLIAAVQQGFVIAARPRDDHRVMVHDVEGGRLASLALDPALPEQADAWARYPATVLRRLARNFPAADTGADLAFLSNLPHASGMSSSSAFMVAVYLAMADLNGLDRLEMYRREIRSREDLAGYLGTIENGQSFGGLTGDRGVGTFGGSEDHTAILEGREAELSVYSFCPVRHERQVPFPADHGLVVAFSGVVAEKTGGAMASYNRASLAARAVLETWNRASGAGHSCLGRVVAEVGPAPIRQAIASAVAAGFETSDLADRFEQFYQESEVILPAAAQALAEGRLGEFGGLVDRSQALAEGLLRNQVPETIGLARTAREQGASAASAFGAGFGGSVWALVPHAEADRFAGRWQREYRAAFPDAARAARFLFTRPGPGAFRLPVAPAEGRP